MFHRNRARLGHRLLLPTIVLTFFTSGALAQKNFQVPLKWTPKEAVAFPSIDMTGGLRALAVEALVDKRDGGKRIGEAPEKKREVVTDSDVPAFVTGVLRDQLKAAGLDVTKDKGERTLRGELLHVWVRDTGSYVATVRVRFTLLDQDKEIWTGVVTGTGENWGRSLKEINYTETLSDALGNLLVNLVNAEPFMKSLRKSGSA